jgi:hypothetical protein
MESNTLINKSLVIALTSIFVLASVSFCPGVLYSTESAKIAFDVAPSAQITAMKYFLQPWEGAKRLHFSVTLKNQSSEPKRFKVSIFLDEGPSGAILFPLQAKKGEEPLMPSQKELTQTLPLFFEGISTSFTIKVEEF